MTVFSQHVGFNMWAAPFNKLSNGIVEKYLEKNKCNTKKFFYKIVTINQWIDLEIDLSKGRIESPYILPFSHKNSND